MNLWCINFRRAIHLRFSAKGIHQEMKFYESSVYKFTISDFFPSLNQHSQNVNMPSQAEVPAMARRHASAC
jgi:hypothetical protein